MYSYDPKEHIISISFDSENLFDEAKEAIDKVIINFFGDKAFNAMNNKDYIDLFNSILDSIKY